MPIKKTDYIVLVFAAILLIILFAIIYYSFATTTNPTKSTPSPTPTRAVQSGTNPTPTSPPLYQPQAQTILINRLENRPELTTNDADAKTKILALLSPSSTNNTLYQSQNVIIDYVPTADVFQVEILTIDVQKAKEEATNWFLGQGVSQQGICNYPVQFYLNFDVAQSLRKLNATFSPLGLGC